MNTCDLAKAYSTGGRGLIFRLRSRSPNQALAYRLQHGPAPSIETATPAALPVTSNGRH